MNGRICSVLLVVWALMFSKKGSTTKKSKADFTLHGYDTIFSDFSGRLVHNNTGFIWKYTEHPIEATTILTPKAALPTKLSAFMRISLFNLLLFRG